MGTWPGSARKQRDAASLEYGTGSEDDEGDEASQGYLGLDFCESDEDFGLGVLGEEEDEDGDAMMGEMARQ